MSNFIYSVRDFFDTTNGCLADNGVKGFFIAPYQRGYKWKSKSINDHIPVLLMDLYEAFLKSKTQKAANEYYLQYITVKKTTNHLFEVIDGQQRLTTLSLLFNTIEHTGYDSENITKSNNEYLVQYSRYQDSQINIFDFIKYSLNDKSCNPEELEEQDKFYMLQASKCIFSFFEIFKAHSADYVEFINFIKNDVKLILNKEDELTSSEEIFSSLNNNKVPLTNAYLIKGLLLTKASRIKSESSYKKYKEIMDERSIMGRTWDEMNAWFSNPEIALFFFGDMENGMEEFLKLIEFNKKSKAEIISSFKKTLLAEKRNITGNYALFNRFHENVITAEEGKLCLEEIKHKYKRLKSWYYDSETYNLIGYHKSIRNTDYNLKSLLETKSNSELINILRATVADNINFSEEEIGQLGYKQYDSTHNILLAINVFPINQIGDLIDYRFNFYSLEKESWSLEHIFPRNPDKGAFNLKNDLSWIFSKIKEREENEPEQNVNLEKLREDLLKDPDSVDIERLDFLFKEINNPDEVGNMALLSKNVNSALNNSFFNTKRKVLLNRINKGFFVPNHTIDAFSKMLELNENLNSMDEKISFGESLTVWEQKDINAHKAWIMQRVTNLKKVFKG